MTTTPSNSSIATTANPTILPKWVVTWETFVKAHEKLLVVLVTGLLLWHFGDKAYDAYENYRKEQATITQQQLNQATTDNKTLAQTLAQMQVKYDADMLALNAKIAKSKQTVIIQQKADAALPLPDLSARWQSMLTLPEGSITPQSNGTIVVTSDAAHATVSELDKVGPLTDQNVDLTLELKSCTDLSAQKDKNLAGAQNELVLDKKARAEDAVIAKDAQRKSFWKGFKWGYAAGITTAILVKIATIVK